MADPCHHSFDLFLALYFLRSDQTPSIVVLLILSFDFEILIWKLFESQQTRHLSTFLLLRQRCLLWDCYEGHRKWFLPCFMSSLFLIKNTGHGTEKVNVRLSSYSTGRFSQESTKSNSILTGFFHIVIV